jgi:hypothetical protein
MRRCIVLGLAVLALWMGRGDVTRADSPFSLYYMITDLGNGTYDYSFDLVLDNNSGTWAAGQGFGWFIFGDAQDMPSPLADFQMDDGVFPVGPWDDITISSETHNGPTFIPIYDEENLEWVTWVPSGIGDSLQWSGVSAAYLDQGQMLFSSIHTEGGAPIFEFEVATLIP